jgi:hypothetical protein
MRKAVQADDYSVIALDKFIQATRDSGYKGTTSAVSELADNAIQAGATRIAISVSNNQRIPENLRTSKSVCPGQRLWNGSDYAPAGFAIWREFSFQRSVRTWGFRYRFTK